MSTWTRKKGRSKAKSQEVDYLYGYHSVLPALEQGRRVAKAVHVRESGSDPSSTEDNPHQTYQDRLLALAHERDIPIVKHTSREGLSRLSGGRPHQGVVLETETLRQLPRLTQLTWPSPPLGGEGQGQEDESKYYYGIPTDAPNHLLPFSPPQIKGRYPLWLALDRIQDPQNLGAILRSAYYFGVDGVVLGMKEAALPSSTASRASAGAMEYFEHFYHTSRMRSFLQVSDPDSAFFSSFKRRM